MTYPQVLSEDETLEIAISGRPISRYGDGELKLIHGHDCVSQIYVPELAKELAAILKEKNSPVLACIPNIAKTHVKHWQNYKAFKYSSLFNPIKLYGSSFITRPDSAPWIDRPDYWSNVEKIWRNKDVILVIGTERSLRVDSLVGANSVRVINTVRRDCYSDIDRIEEEIGITSNPVLLCIGATATVLARRLAAKNILGLDLGHIGMFMRHAGAYDVTKKTLISDEYLRQNKCLHQSPKPFGNDGHKHAEVVFTLSREIGAARILDYGCGEGTLKKKLRALGCSCTIYEYDPAVSGKDDLPKPAELLVCTDVLEHIEPNRLQNVLRHILLLTQIKAYFVIATRPARQILPDGRNAHLIQENSDWWLAKLSEAEFNIDKVDIKSDKEFRVICSKSQ